MDKTEVKDFVKTKRPNLSAGTLTTYTSIITNLYKKIFGSTDKYELDKFNTKYDEVLNFLKDIPADRRKTTLAAMVVIVNEDVKDNYRKQMMTDIEESKSQDILQKKSDKQEENWVSQQEIKDVYERLYQKIENITKKTLP